MTGAEATVWLRLRVKRGAANVLAAAAAVEDSQGWHLYSQIGFTFFDEELAEFGGELGEGRGEEGSFWGLLAHCASCKVREDGLSIEVRSHQRSQTKPLASEPSIVTLLPFSYLEGT